MKRTRKNRTVKSLTIGYVKTSVDEQVVMSQKLEILEYCRTHDLKVDKWIESEISLHRPSDQKRIRELSSLSRGDTLISTEISRLGRSTSETIGLVNQALKNGVRIVFTKENFDLDLASQSSTVVRIVLTIFSMLTYLEKNIISLRIKEALSTKKRHGFTVGKVRGTVQSSIYDSKREQILFLLSKGISVLDISKIIGIGKPRSLLIYLNRRKLRERKKLKQ